MSTIWKTKRQVVRKNVSKRDVSKELAVILQDATNMLGLTGMGLSFIADYSAMFKICDQSNTNNVPVL